MQTMEEKKSITEKNTKLLKTFTLGNCIFYNLTLITK